MDCTIMAYFLFAWLVPLTMVWGESKFIETDVEPTSHACIRLERDNPRNKCTNLTSCSLYEKCDSSGSGPGEVFCYASYRRTADGKYVTEISGCGNTICQGKVTGCPVRHEKHTPDHMHICCCTGHLCNQNTTFNMSELNEVPAEVPTTATAYTQAPDKELPSSIYILVPVFGMIVIIATCIYLWRKHKRHERLREPLLERVMHSQVSLISRNLDLHDIISHGQFGAVYRATYEGQLVAVKVVPEQERSTWENERRVYSHLNTHENITQFHSAKRIFNNNTMQYCIVTEFHQHGSLQDFLRQSVVSIHDFLCMAIGIASGLVHLHSADERKPIIAHCDMKSNNVLVKHDRTCCLNDFGSAIVFEGSSYNFNIATGGTKRYMSPELLEGAVGYTIDSLLCVDVYAFGLVLWEILLRCNYSNADASSVRPYKSPFEDVVGANPDINEMLVCVSTEKRRPPIYLEWLNHPVLNEVCRTIQECWDADAEARISAHTVLVRFTRLLETLEHSGSSSVINHPDRVVQQSLDLREENFLENSSNRIEVCLENSLNQEETFSNDQIVNLQHNERGPNDDNSTNCTNTVPDNSCQQETSIELSTVDDGTLYHPEHSEYSHDISIL